MTLTFLDLLKYTPLSPCSESDIPHKQGFYLIFDDIGEFIYVGKGWLDDRVKIHFDENAEEGEYFPDACFWCFFVTDNSSQAFAYEKVVYDHHVNETGYPPKHNINPPQGAAASASNLGLSTLRDSLAKHDWNGFLRDIGWRRFMTRLYSHID